jgi:hypothetical protein
MFHATLTLIRFRSSFVSVTPLRGGLAPGLQLKTTETKKDSRHKRGFPDHCL